MLPSSQQVQPTLWAEQVCADAFSTAPDPSKHHSKAELVCPASLQGFGAFDLFWLAASHADMLTEPGCAQRR